MFGTIPIVVKDDFVEDINIENIKEKVESLLPAHLVNGIDIIYIGEFQELHDKEVNALYLDGAIYITNVQTSEQDLIDDLVHETAHFVEEKYTADIYGDSDMEWEFLRKRKKLNSILRQEGYHTPDNFHKELEYNLNIDNFLYREVGYPKLRELTNGIFLSAYSITNVREYFAIGFEYYFLRDKNDVASCCPGIFRILQKLTEG